MMPVGHEHLIFLSDTRKKREGKWLSYFTLPTHVVCPEVFPNQFFSLWQTGNFLVNLENIDDINRVCKSPNFTHNTKFPQSIESFFQMYTLPQTVAQKDDGGGDDDEQVNHTKHRQS